MSNLYKKILKTASFLQGLKGILNKFFDNPIIMGLAIGLFVFVVFAMLYNFKALDNFELTTLEWRFKYFHSRAKASDECVVLAVDRRSLRKLGTWPWQRGVYVKVLNAMEFYGAKSIAFDLFFPFRNTYNPAGDIAFANKVKSLDNVVIAIRVVNIPKKLLKAQGESYEAIVKRFKKFAISLLENENIAAISIKEIYSSFLTKQEMNSNNSNYVVLFSPPFKQLFDSIHYLGFVETSSRDEVITTPLLVKFENNYYPSLSFP